MANGLPMPKPHPKAALLGGPSNYWHRALHPGFWVLVFVDFIFCKIFSFLCRFVAGVRAQGSLNFACPGPLPWVNAKIPVGAGMQNERKRERSERPRGRPFSCCGGVPLCVFGVVYQNNLESSGPLLVPSHQNNLEYIGFLLVPSHRNNLDYMGFLLGPSAAYIRSCRKKNRPCGALSQLASHQPAGCGTNGEKSRQKFASRAGSLSALPSKI